MGAIQIKNVPEELHVVIRRRAADEGISLSDYVLNLIRRDAALPTKDEWLAMVKAEWPLGRGGVDVVKTVHEAREERAAQIDAVVRGD